MGLNGGGGDGEGGGETTILCRVASSTTIKSKFLIDSMWLNRFAISIKKLAYLLYKQFYV